MIKRNHPKSSLVLRTATQHPVNLVKTPFPLKADSQELLQPLVGRWGRDPAWWIIDMSCSKHFGANLESRYQEQTPRNPFVHLLRNPLKHNIPQYFRPGLESKTDPQELKHLTRLKQRRFISVELDIDPLSLQLIAMIGSYHPCQVDDLPLSYWNSVLGWLKIHCLSLSSIDSGWLGRETENPVHSIIRYGRLRG